MKSSIQTISIIAVLFGLLLTSCAKDEEEPSNTGGEMDNTSKVLISCEGSFLQSNASLSEYDETNGVVVNSVFMDASSFPLGDVLQSVARIDDELYACMNNSGTVEVFAEDDYESIATIQNMGFPRYIIKTRSDRAFVSNLSNDMRIVDLDSYSMVGVFPMQGETTGEMAVVDEKLFVCVESSSELKVIDVETELTITDITVGRTPVSIEVDSDGMIWVLNSGLWYDPADNWNPVQEDARLTQIDPSDYSIIQTIDFPEDAGMVDIAMSASGDAFFLLQGDEVSMVSTDSGIVTPLFDYNLNGAYYGKIGVDPDNDDLYVSQYGDFVNPGVVERYDFNGTLTDQITVGIAPNGFLFD